MENKMTLEQAENHAGDAVEIYVCKNGRAAYCEDDFYFLWDCWDHFRSIKGDPIRDETNDMLEFAEWVGKLPVIREH